MLKDKKMIYVWYKIENLNKSYYTEKQAKKYELI